MAHPFCKLIYVITSLSSQKIMNVKPWYKDRSQFQPGFICFFVCLFQVNISFIHLWQVQCVGVKRLYTYASRSNFSINSFLLIYQYNPSSIIRLSWIRTVRIQSKLFVTFGNSFCVFRSILLVFQPLLVFQSFSYNSAVNLYIFGHVPSVFEKKKKKNGEEKKIHTFSRPSTWINC